MGKSNSQFAKEKIRVGVILGGRSGEHEVSLMSAQSVISALDPQKYDIVPIGITPTGHWVTGNVIAALEAPELEMDLNLRQATLLPEPQSSALLQLDVKERDQTTLSIVTELDVVIPVLHGPYGEDGTVQGFLELAGLPYVGAGVVGSAVGMDKAIFKYTMMANDIPVLPWLLVKASEWFTRPKEILNEIEAKLDYPVFTKPANLGSSVGISRCKNRQELITGIDESAKFDRRIVVEQGINARELEVSVLGNDNPDASIVGEIRPRREFYDYVAKYMAAPGSEDESELLIPADISSQLSDKVRRIAIKAYKAIDCAGMGRVDLLLDKDSGKLYMNEINTIPGFTRISMYPKLWEATGVTYQELLDRLITLALERFEEKEGFATTLDKAGNIEN